MRGYLRHIPQWRRVGYLVKLYFLALPDPEFAIRRVERRVRFSRPLRKTVLNFVSGAGSGGFSMILVEDTYTNAVNLSGPSGGTASYVLQPGRFYELRMYFVSGVGTGSGFFSGPTSDPGTAFTTALGTMVVTPVPEPSALMRGAVGVLALARRRR